MAILKPLVSDGALNRQVQAGVVVGGAEIINNLTTVGAGTLTAALLLGGIINRTGPTAGYIDTTDTAANIIAALISQYSYQAANTGLSGGVAASVGLSTRLRFINTVAFANTTAAGTGVTLVNASVSASSVKEFLIQITNGTPQQIFAANQVNATAVITGLS